MLCLVYQVLDRVEIDLHLFIVATVNTFVKYRDSVRFQ